MSRTLGLLVLSLLCLSIAGFGFVVLSMRPAPQTVNPASQAFVLESTADYTLLFVPETAVTATYAQQWARGYHCTGLGTRVNAGMNSGFYWVCHNGATPAQEDTKE